MRKRKITIRLLLTVFVVMIMTSAALADDGVIRINFQPPGHPQPLRTGIVHLEDIGEAYGDRGNGEYYGWSSDNTDDADRRYSIADCRLDGNVDMSGTDYWEVALPNGDYLVNITMGDSKYGDVIHDFDLEGTIYNDPDGQDYFDPYEDLPVTISDGKLTIVATGGDPRICFIEIVDAAIGFPAKQTFPPEDPSQPAFPTAEGAAKNLTGGRGGDVYHVTSLDWTGPGSLQWGLLTIYDNHPRTIVFDIGGYIGCSNPGPPGQIGSNGCGGADGDMNLNGFNITIAGQTAPGKGITIRDHNAKIKNSGNIIMRYLRFRLGDENKGTQDVGDDVLTPEDNDGIMLDHLSVSWGIDGEMDSRRCGKFTTQWCIFAEPLHDSIHYEGAPHGYLMSWRNVTDECTIHHNLFTSGASRHPTIGANELVDYEHLSDFRNNVNYNFGGNTKMGSTFTNFINNYYKYGPASWDDGNTLDVQNNLPNPWGYLTGNFWTSIDSRDAADCAAYNADNYAACSYGNSEGATRADYEAFSEFAGSSPITESAADAYQAVVANAGCSLVRDTVDERIMDYVVNSTGYLDGYSYGIVDSQNDVGGWDPYTGQTRPAGFDTDQDGMPDTWETARGLNPSDPDDRNGDDDSDGYTNLEEYLNALTGEGEDDTAPTPDPMTWDVPPYAVSDAAISMTATTASDINGEEYYFTCTAGGGNDGGWQDSTIYTDSGLSASTQYTYTVTARDKSVEQNETAPSTAESATTDPLDTTPPTPDPMTWATAPYSTGSSSISMTATTASDISGVEYYFTCTAGGGNDSGWQDSTTYEDTGLENGVEYTYIVTACDKSASQNMTAASSPASATTDAFAPIYINFQIDTAPVPAGYIMDYGQLYGDQGNGYSYGWDADNTGEGRDRNTDPDQRYDTLVHMDTDVWELEIANGDYLVDLVTGDPSNTDQINDLSVEGVLVNDPDGYDNFDEYFGISVTVSDGKLTVSPQASADNPKLCFIDIRLAGPADTDPPTPDPMTWASPPASTGPTSIAMTATTASDPSGVEYYFTCTAGGGNDSGWQDSTLYEDTGLAPETQYTYTVTASDKSANQNETAASSPANATTDAPPPALPWSDGFESGSFTAGGWTTTGSPIVSDATEYSGTYGAKIPGTASIETAIDTTGFTSIHVKYRRETKGLDAGENLIVEWYDGNSWTPLETIEDCSYEDGLQDKTCGAGADNNANFKIRFRTTAGAANEYASIDDIEVTGTSAGPDTDPPTPEPMTWATAPYSTGSSSIAMIATAAIDPSGVEYYFTCTAGGGNDSGWQDSTTYEDTGLTPSTQYTYTATARDKSANQNETGASTALSATTDPPSEGDLPWAEDFESGSFTAGGWITTGSPTVSNKAEYSGTYGAKIPGTASIETAISTVGFTGIHVKYRRQTKGLDTGENLVVEWYDGSGWNPLETVQNAAYTDGLQDKTCGIGADNNANFRIRFSTNAGSSNEYAYIDDIEVTGI